MTDRERAWPTWLRGDHLTAARLEADAADRDGYDKTAIMLRGLADELEQQQDALEAIRMALSLPRSKVGVWDSAKQILLRIEVIADEALAAGKKAR